MQIKHWAMISMQLFDLPANFDPCYNSEQGYDEFGIDEVYE